MSTFQITLLEQAKI